jgi:hypothetical protein
MSAARAAAATLAEADCQAVLASNVAIVVVNAVRNSR